MKDIEKILQEGNAIKIKPLGYSMYPVIVPKKDEVIIEPVKDFSLLKKADVVLYRRDESILVLHRIYKITSQGIYLVGDNQDEIEGPLRFEQVKGKLVCIIKNQREISVNNFLYKFISHFWLLMCPFRKYVKKPAVFIRKKIKKISCR